MRAIVTCLLLGIGAPAFAEASINWVENLETAKEKAREERKDIFLLFTGESWCCACIALERSVLKTPEFAEEFGSRFIFVKYVHSGKPLREADIENDPAARDKSLQVARFRVDSLPEMFLLDAQGRTYNRVLNIGGDYKDRVGELRTKMAEKEVLEKKLADAMANTDVLSRARTLDTILSDINTAKFLVGYENEMQMVADGDPSLRAKYLYLLALQKSHAAISVLNGQKSYEVCENFINGASFKEITTQQQQEILVQKAKSMAQLNRKEEAVEVLKAAVALDSKDPVAQNEMEWLKGSIARGYRNFGR